MPSPPRPTSLPHDGGCGCGCGCGCKIVHGVLSEILKNSRNLPCLNLPDELLGGIGTADDVAVHRLNDKQALIATTDFFMPMVDEPHDFGRIAVTNVTQRHQRHQRRVRRRRHAHHGPWHRRYAGQRAATGNHRCDPAQWAGRVPRCWFPIAGGHTVVSRQPVCGLVMLEPVHPSRIKKNSGAQAGDVLILGKPLCVGILSAALKKETLSARGYAQMIAVTTQLNKPDIELAKMDTVHAMTDVTGFGLLGHRLELARGAHLKMQLAVNQVPLLPGVLELAQAGIVTGASGRNWNSCGAEMVLPAAISPAHNALVSDPQTSGGLLVACAPEAADAVLA